MPVFLLALHPVRHQQLQLRYPRVVHRGRAGLSYPTLLAELRVELVELLDLFVDVGGAETLNCVMKQ